jgi:hypothetical protein
MTFAQGHLSKDVTVTVARFEKHVALPAQASGLIGRFYTMVPATSVSGFCE